MYKGIDLLGLAMMNPYMISSAMKPGCSFGFLMGTFGDAIPAAEYILQHNQPPACRVHLSNGPCARNHNCGEGEIGASQFGKLEERASKINSLAVHYSHTKFFISPRVEHDEVSVTAKHWLDVLQLHASFCTPVLSCGPNGHDPHGYLEEDHGNEAHGDIISNDGESILDTHDYKIPWVAGAEIMALAWDYSCNFRSKNEHTFVTPRKRDLKLGPTHDILIRMQEAIGL